MMREPAKIQGVNGIGFLVRMSRIMLDAQTCCVLPSFSKMTDSDNGGPVGGSHCFNASLKCTGSPGFSPIARSAACRCDGRTFERSTDSYSFEPVEQRKNSSGFEHASASH